MSDVPNSPRSRTAEEEMSWAAIIAALDEFVAAFRNVDVEGMAAAGDRARSIPFDIEAFTNAIRVPRDAGDDAAALEAILRRIPDGWGRWIDVARGWYPIVISLDLQLAGLDPGYRVLQVKEKFGALRYYWEPNETNGSATVREQGDEFVRVAEALAARTCEDCGQVGAPVSRQGWLRTLCQTCASKLGYEAA